MGSAPAATAPAPAPAEEVPELHHTYEELGFTPFDAALRRTEVVVRVTDRRTGAVLGARKVMKGAVATLCALSHAPHAAAQAESEAEHWNAITHEQASKGWRSIAVAATDILNVDEKQVKRHI